MDIQYMIDIANKKIDNLIFEKNCAYQIGDEETVLSLDNEIAKTYATIDKLNTLI